MGLTPQQKESVLVLEGPQLSAEVERVVFGRDPCHCPGGIAMLSDDGLCASCAGGAPPLWSESDTAAKYLRGSIFSWTPFYRDRFLDYLGQCISIRNGQGAVQPRLWVLMATPTDICRAAILVKMEA